jgi:hypothetical protein
MKRYQTAAVVLGFALLCVSSLIFLGCEVGSSDSVTRNIGVDFTGFYDSTATNSDFVTPANSGARVTSFNLRQSGDQLEAIDNHNIIFHGSVGDPSGSAGTGTSAFQLEGYTTAGQPVTISGTLSGANTGDNSASATMDGTWIEPNLYAHILGDAIINVIQTNQPGSSVTISASTSTISTNGATATLTASGGSGSYSSWSVSDGAKGSVSPTSGQTVTYTRLNTGNVTVTVTDSASQQGQITISQP